MIHLRCIGLEWILLLCMSTNNQNRTKIAKNKQEKQNKTKTTQETTTNRQTKNEIVKMIKTLEKLNMYYERRKKLF